jgi:hypothetical protein
MPHDATANRSDHGMVPRDMAGYSADDCAFQAARCVCRTDGRK